MSGVSLPFYIATRISEKNADNVYKAVSLFISKLHNHQSHFPTIPQLFFLPLTH